MLDQYKTNLEEYVAAMRAANEKIRQILDMLPNDCVYFRQWLVTHNHTLCGMICEARNWLSKIGDKEYEAMLFSDHPMYTDSID